jgi:UDP-galactose transporter B1
LSGAGQNFVFYCVHQFGALATSLITTTRKFFTIIFSVFIFGHPVNATQWAGVVLVFVALGVDTLLKYRGKASGKSDATTVPTKAVKSM